MDKENEILFDTHEAAEYLKVPARVLEAWRYRHTGPAFIRYNHSKVRYRKRDLIAWLDARTVTPAGHDVAAVA
ncbi:helix-turn-helix transcriptional regulator [Candidatus Binatus sp.]|uniref:helix-turn-helix transcriptional regulator n=1 Tax=Candidatus Binatus sp. TaxID=2811406 RepID=UPI003CC5134F